MDASSLPHLTARLALELLAVEPSRKPCTTSRRQVSSAVASHRGAPKKLCYLRDALSAASALNHPSASPAPSVSSGSTTFSVEVQGDIWDDEDDEEEEEENLYDMEEDRGRLGAAVGVRTVAEDDRLLQYMCDTKTATTIHTTTITATGDRSGDEGAHESGLRCVIPTSS